MAALMVGRYQVVHLVHEMMAEGHLDEEIIERICDEYGWSEEAE